MPNIEKDVIEVLNRRSAFLQSLLESPKSKRTLVEELDTSRSTIDRGVRELESLGIIEYGAGHYSSTPVGDFLGKSFFDFQKTIEVIIRLSPFLEWMDSGWFDVELCSLQNARMYIADSNDSFGPWDSHAKTVRSTQLYRALLPSVGREPMEVKYQSILENESEHEVIVSPEVADTLQSEPIIKVFEDMLATGRVSVSVCNEPIPYYLGLFDGVVQIGSCGNHGLPHALLEADNPDVLEWGETKYESYKTKSTPFY